MKLHYVSIYIGVYMCFFMCTYLYQSMGMDVRDHLGHKPHQFYVSCRMYVSVCTCTFLYRGAVCCVPETGGQRHCSCRLQLQAAGITRRA